MRPCCSLGLLLAIPLLACRAPQAAPAGQGTVVGAPGPRYALHTTLAGVPREAGWVRVVLEVPQRAVLGDLAVVGLFGNAPFEVRLPEREPGRLVSGALVLEWVPRGATGLLSVETRGRAPEIGLCFVLAPEAADAVAELREEFRRGTRAQVDGRDWTAVDTRLERVR